MSGGSVAGFAEAHDQAVINYSGGTIAGGVHTQFSTLAMPLRISAGPSALLSSLNLTAFDAATINFIGLNLTATLIDPNYQSGMFSEYELTGTLADGSQVDGTFLIENGTGASYELTAPVPEPSVTTLMIVAIVSWFGFATVAGRRRRRQ